jgi:ribonuclease BN (tRNA processing enzyme)
MTYAIGALALLVVLAMTFPASGTADGGTPPADSTVVVLLGTGTPRPDPLHRGPAAAVVVGKRVFLFDAGAGVEQQLAAAGLPIAGPEAVFITHLHTDHTLGFPDLIFTSWVMGRRAPLQAFGPPGLRAMTDHLAEAYAEDIRIRTEGLEHETPNAWKVDVHETRGGAVYDSGGVRITAFPVPHGNWPVALGYRIDTPDRSVVISGDTRYSEEVARQAAGVDVLVHEVYAASAVEPEQRSGGDDWPRYMKEFHTSDQELGRLAAQAKPALLVLTHAVYRSRVDAESIQVIREAGYEGRVVIGQDLGRY